MTYKKTFVLLTAFFISFLLGNFQGYSSSDYDFRDSSGNTITVPDRPIIRIKEPGMLLAVLEDHNPSIQVKSRKEGLEDIRYLTVSFGSKSPANDLRQAVYVTDKDGLVIGYELLSENELSATFRINGVINFVHLMIECQEHGLWVKSLALNLQS